MTAHRNEEMIGISWIDRQLGDLLAVAQSQMGPGRARIDRFVNAIADR